MNKVLKEAIFRQRVRRIHRVASKKMLVEQEHNLYTTFVQPFTDVVAAVGLTGQDILNSVKLSLDLLLTISPKKMDAALKSFDERKAKIETKWAPIVERTQAALANADADVLAMVFAPHLFLATAALQKGYEASGNLGKAIGDAGFKIPFASAILGYTPDDKPDRPASSGASGEKGILGKMISLFYVEGTWHEGELILEKEKEKEDQAPKPPPLEKALEDYLDASGLKDQFEKDADEMLDITLDALADPKVSPLPQGVIQLAITRQLANASNLEDFAATFEMARAQGLDLKEVGLDKLKEELDAGVEQLMQSDDFKQQISGEADKSEKAGGKESKDLEEAENDPAKEEVPQVPEDKLRKAAEKVVFNNSAQNMRSKASEAIPKMEKQLTDYLSQVTPPKGSLDIIKDDPRGARINSTVADFKKKISG